MKELTRRFATPVLLLIGLGIYVLIAGTTGSCAACSAVTNALGLGGNTAQKPPAPSDSRGVAPTWAGVDLDGNPISGESLQGSVYLLDFWATWCGPCQRMVPDLVQLEAKYGERGFKVVGVSLDREGEAIVRRFNQRHNVTYPTVMATREIVEAFGNIQVIPTSFLVDRSGRIVSRHVGYVEPSVLEREIESHL